MLKWVKLFDVKVSKRFNELSTLEVLLKRVDNLLKVVILFSYCKSFRKHLKPPQSRKRAFKQIWSPLICRDRRRVVRLERLRCMSMFFTRFDMLLCRAKAHHFQILKHCGKSISPVLWSRWMLEQYEKRACQHVRDNTTKVMPSCTFLIMFEHPIRPKN